MSTFPKEETLHSILLVDNDPDFVKTTTYFFSETGYVIDVAESGYEAITKVKNHHYGVVLLNIDHIDRDGLTLFHSLIHRRPILFINFKDASLIQVTHALVCPVHDTTVNSVTVSG